jgi:hypothetical protein
MPPELFKKYLTAPIACTEEVIAACKLRPDKYFSVSVWPEHLAGRVFETKKLVREVKLKKISKSNDT